MTGIAQERMQTSAIVLAVAGDRTAFARIVSAYHGDMVRVAYVVAGGNQDLADDAVQSAWSIAWRKLGSLRDPERLKPWLLRIAANEARQLIRRQHGVVDIDMAAARPGGRDPGARVGEIDLADVIRRLPPDDRVLLALRYDAGLDSAEIGALSGMSASAVRGRIARLLDRLRRELTDA